MKRTGVIVGTVANITNEHAEAIVQSLNNRFPGVTFAVAAQAHSVAFEFDDRTPPIPYGVQPPVIEFEPEYYP